MLAAKTWRINGRRGGIRTRDPLHPMQLRYQAALHADKPRIIARESLGLTLEDSVGGGEQIADLEKFPTHLQEPL